MALIFFDSKQKLRTKKQDLPCNFVAVGGDKFHAVAVALIDQFKSSEAGEEQVLKKIIHKYFKLFPNALTNQAYLSASERMIMLINTSRMSELVSAMAETLKQIAWDEMYSKASQYPEIFQGLDPKTTKAQLRQSQAPMHPSALGALRSALGLNITLCHMEFGKEIRSREIMNVDSRQEVFEDTMKKSLKK